MADLQLVINGTEITVPDADVTAAVAAGKLELKNDNLLLFQRPEFETRIKTESDSAYIRGKIAGEEMPVKAFKKTMGVEIESKNINEIVTAFKENVLTEAKIEPSKSVKEKETMIEQLRANMAKLEEEKTSLSNQTCAPFFGFLRNGFVNTLCLFTCTHNNAVVAQLLALRCALLLMVLLMLSEMKLLVMLRLISAFWLKRSNTEIFTSNASFLVTTFLRVGLNR
jgi:hypothetical protein